MKIDNNSVKPLLLNNIEQQLAVMDFLIANGAKLVGSRMLGLNTENSDCDYLLNDDVIATSNCNY